MKTVYLIGDSIFGKLKQDDLIRLDKSLSATTVNCAYGGASSGDAIKRYQWCTNIKNEIFVLCIGHNDVHKKTPLQKFEKNINQLLAVLKDNEVYILLLPPVDIIHYPSEGRKFNNRAGKYINILSMAAVTHKNTTIVDLLDRYYKLMSSGVDYHIGDGVHMNTIGYDIIFESLRDAVRH